MPQTRAPTSAELQSEPVVQQALEQAWSAIMTTVDADQERTKQLLSCVDVLGIAHRDAEKAYRDLSGYRISLIFQPDGWHVDYDLVEPYVAGGGPHYVIDPQTGTIVSKRYEQ